MTTPTVPMPTKKNPPPEPPGEGKYNVSCKLRAGFADKLKMVAADYDRPPGALIEEHMAEWVEAQYLRVLKRRLAEAEQAQRGDRPGGR